MWVLLCCESVADRDRDRLHCVWATRGSAVMQKSVKPSALCGRFSHNSAACCGVYRLETLGPAKCEGA